MENKKKTEGKFTIIRKEVVNTPESLKTIPHGTTVKVSCAEFVCLNTVQCAITRLNQKLQEEGKSPEYKVTTPDNGGTLIISRK